MQQRDIFICLSWIAILAIVGASTPVFARDAVAQVLGKVIYRDAIQGQGKGLGAAIIPPLMRRYAVSQQIVASRVEIDEVESLMFRPLPSDLAVAERTELHRIAESMVLDWKISKSLYQRYGGVVIFQQANPMEPVGAIRSFLEQEEQSGAFTIYGAADRAEFFDYFVRPQRGVIPPSKVNYDKPWWRK
jgi:hypothetical protein